MTDREMSELKQVGGYIHAEGQPGMEIWSPTRGRVCLCGKVAWNRQWA